MPVEATPINPLRRPDLSQDPVVMEGREREDRLDQETEAGAAALDQVFGPKRSEESFADSLVDGAPVPKADAQGAPAPTADDAGVRFPGVPESVIPQAAPVEPPPARTPGDTPAPDTFDADTQAAVRGMGKKQADAFIKERVAHRTDVKNREAKIQELEAKLAALANDPAAVQERSELSKKVTDLEKQVQEYEDKLGRFDLQQTRGFQEKFVRPMETLDNRFVRIVSQYGDMEPSAAAEFTKKLVTASPEERKQLIADLPTAVGSTAIDYLDQRQAIAEQRAAAEQNWKATQAAMSESERRAFQLSFSKEVEQSVTDAARVLAEGGNVYFRTAPGNTPAELDWNAKVDDRVRVVEGVLRSGDTKQIAQYVAEGAAFASLLAAFTAQQRALNAAQRQLEVVTGAQPRLVPPGGPPEVPPAHAPKPRSSDEAMTSIWGRERNMTGEAVSIGG